MPDARLFKYGKFERNRTGALTFPFLRSLEISAVEAATGSSIEQYLALEAGLGKDTPFLAGSAGGKLRTGRYLSLKPDCPPGHRYCEGSEKVVIPTAAR